jgi:Bacterial SH3 domain
MSERSESHLRLAEATASEGPTWKVVAGVAVVCFATGVVWPKATGLAFGPVAPCASNAGSSGTCIDETPPQSPHAGAPGSTHGAAPTAPTPALAATAGASAGISSGAVSAEPTAATTTPNATANTGAGALVPNGELSSARAKYQRTVFITCHDASGKKLATCTDNEQVARSFAHAVLTTMDACIGKESGKLSLLANVDYASKRVRASLGKSSGLRLRNEAVLCLEKGMATAISTANDSHGKERYLLALQFEVSEAGSEAAKPTSSSEALPNASASSEHADIEPGALATGDKRHVQWDAVHVRESPRTGAILFRLQKGAEVVVLKQEGSWCEIEAEQKRGWIHRGAL